MKVLPTAISSLYAYVNPLVAMLVAAEILSEKLTINILWGSMVTLIGVYLVNLSIKRKEKKLLLEPEQ
jgi:drug/metabolite transporter (DMT)-like permease